MGVSQAADVVVDVGQVAEEGTGSRPCAFALPFNVAKTDEDQCLVFGWLSIAADAEGRLLVDKQGDIIPPEELEQAGYQFTLDSRESDTLHDGVPSGRLVESVVMTLEKQQAMGIPSGAVPVGWWVGFQVDPSIFARVKSGELQAFSIGGSAIREAVNG